MPYRGWIMTVGLLAVGLGVGACGGGGAEDLGCCNSDAPECDCFDDTGAWDPVPGFLTHVAHATLGTHVSCVSHGGKPYYQMRLGLNSRSAAQIFACALQEAPALIPPEFAVRDDWCSEAISYWHREAEIPYRGGYRGSEWILDWQLDTTYQLETFYVTEEGRAGGRGRWIHWDEIDYTDFRPGINAPVPGSYILIRRINASGDWIGTSRRCSSNRRSCEYAASAAVSARAMSPRQPNAIDRSVGIRTFSCGGPRYSPESSLNR